MDFTKEILIRMDQRIRELPNGCWEWQGVAPNNKGYTHVRLPGLKNRKLAHRICWERAHGPVPSGLVLDHLCRNRACCNPAHLEIVTNRENVLRGEGPPAVMARRTHCQFCGMELAGNNLRVSGNGRQCRYCIRTKKRMRRHFGVEVTAEIIRRFGMPLKWTCSAEELAKVKGVSVERARKWIGE